MNLISNITIQRLASKNQAIPVQSLQRAWGACV